MRQRTLFVLAALLVVAVAAVPVAGLAATGDAPAQKNDSTHNQTTADNETNESVAPGERFAGVVNVQEAEFEGEVGERAYGIKVAKAASNESKAEVVKAQLEDVEQRLAELEQRKQDLAEARENGSISEGRYRAEMSELAVKTETAKRLANQSENVTRGLPADVLTAKGNATAIQSLQERAGQLAGPEVADIARSIAGPDVGGPPGDRGPGELPDRPGQHGPSDRPGGPDTPDGHQGDDADDQQPTSRRPPSDRATDGHYA